MGEKNLKIGIVQREFPYNIKSEKDAEEHLEKMVKNYKKIENKRPDVVVFSEITFGSPSVDNVEVRRRLEKYIERGVIDTFKKISSENENTLYILGSVFERPEKSISEILKQPKTEAVSLEDNKHAYLDNGKLKTPPVNFPGKKYNGKTYYADRFNTTIFMKDGKEIKRHRKTFEPLGFSKDHYINGKKLPLAHITYFVKEPTIIKHKDVKIGFGICSDQFGCYDPDNKIQKNGVSDSSSYIEGKLYSQYLKDKGAELIIYSIGRAGDPDPDKNQFWKAMEESQAKKLQIPLIECNRLHSTIYLPKGNEAFDKIDIKDVPAYVGTLNFEDMSFI